MTARLKDLDYRWVLFIAAGIVLFNALVVLVDIPVLKQFVSFLFLTLVPGALIVFILRLQRLDLTTQVVLSVGISVAFVMFFGLFVNSASLALGYTKPLATIPLLVSFSMGVLILAFVAYIRNRGQTFTFSRFNLTTREKALLALPAFFPLLSIVGMRSMNLNNSNSLLMALLLLTPAYVIVLSFVNRIVPGRVYPAAIFLIGISLLLMFPLRSNHLIGEDIHDEYYFYQRTLENLHWRPWLEDLLILRSLLSISVLPAIFHSFLDIDPEYLYKVLFSLIASIFPLAVYLLAKRQVGSFYAFIASFFFMAQTMFLETAIHPRTNIAILFFGLALLALFHEGLTEFAKRVLFLVFAATIIVSHYSTTYIALAVFLLTLAGSEILLRLARRRREGISPGPYVLGGSSLSPKAGEIPSPGAPIPARVSLGATTPWLSERAIGTISVMLLFVAIFFWYSQVSIFTFTSGVQFIYKIFQDLGDFFLVESRGQVVQAALGKGLATSGIPRRVDFILRWLSLFFIAIAMLATVIKVGGTVFRSRRGGVGNGSKAGRLDLEYDVLSVVAFGILGLTIALPGITTGYDVSRPYFQMLVPLAVFFVIGGMTVARFLRVRLHLIVLLVAIAYFLSTSGVSYQLFGYPKAITLNSTGWFYDTQYLYDQDVSGVKWLAAHRGLKSYREKTTIYTDGPTGEIFVGYARLTYPQVKTLLFLYKGGYETEGYDGYLFLKRQNVVKGELFYSTTVYDFATFPQLFEGKNRIYTSGGPEIYR